MIDKHSPGWIDGFLHDGPLAPSQSSANLRPYILIDCAFMPDCHRTISKHAAAGRWISLYRDTSGASQEVIENSPILLDTEGMDETPVRSLLSRTDGLPMLSVIRSPEPLEVLHERLSPWCIVDADGQFYVLRFPDTRRLPDVWSVLSDMQRTQFAGPGVEWHYRGRDAAWQVLRTPADVPPEACKPCRHPRLDGDQCAALIGASEPDEIIANALRFSPQLRAQHLPSALHALASRALAVADAMKTSAPEQRARLCELFWNEPAYAQQQKPDFVALRALLA